MAVTPVTAAQLPHYVEQLKQKDGFAAEFKTIAAEAAAGPTEVAGSPANASKNRSNDIVPFDGNRVVLPPRGSLTDDYINASYIKGVDGKVGYIACQSPLPSTVASFWRMVVASKTNVLVMLCPLEENGKASSEAYWLADGEEMAAAQIEVKVHDENDYDDFVLRTLAVTDLQVDDSQWVYQLHYTTWRAGHQAQSSEGLLEFVKFLAHYQNAATGPVVVHGRDGSGRTGTLIALDLIRQLSSGPQGADTPISVYSIVSDLRKQRMGLVQDEAQYHYLYELASEMACADYPDQVQAATPPASSSPTPAAAPVDDLDEEPPKAEEKKEVSVVAATVAAAAATAKTAAALHAPTDHEEESPYTNLEKYSPTLQQKIQEEEKEKGARDEGGKVNVVNVVKENEGKQVEKKEEEGGRGEEEEEESAYANLDNYNPMLKEKMEKEERERKEKEENEKEKEKEEKAEEESPYAMLQPYAGKSTAPPTNPPPAPTTPYAGAVAAATTATAGVGATVAATTDASTRPESPSTRPKSPPASQTSRSSSPPRASSPTQKPPAQRSPSPIRSPVRSPIPAHGSTGNINESQETEQGGGPSFARAPTYPPSANVEYTQAPHRGSLSAPVSVDNNTEVGKEEEKDEKGGVSRAKSLGKSAGSLMKRTSLNMKRGFAVFGDSAKKGMSSVTDKMGRKKSGGSAVIEEEGAGSSSAMHESGAPVAAGVAAGAAAGATASTFTSGEKFSRRQSAGSTNSLTEKQRAPTPGSPTHPAMPPPRPTGGLKLFSKIKSLPLRVDMSKVSTLMHVPGHTDLKILDNVEPVEVDWGTAYGERAIHEEVNVGRHEFPSMTSAEMEGFGFANRYKVPVGPRPAPWAAT